ncbi:hypothetical protein Tco_0629748 [Tanacetum coccineum]|uniref:Uncharacterized protein n=1 Tax=Tanacetum coccineum TaxID=301880 RepID=A0ABQ4WUQ2_9ASTR
MSTANQQTLTESGTEGRPLILKTGTYVPWASWFLRFLDNKREEGELMRYSIDHGPLKRKLIDDPKNDGKKILWFRWISFDYRVTLGFGSIAGGLDHVNPIIRLLIEHGISKGTRIGTMAGVDITTLTMEQYLALSRENQEPVVVKPEIGGNVNFEIKSQFMRELREDTFFGNKNKEAHDHIDRVLNIVSLFNIPGVSQDVVLLRVFPFTLTGSAKRWVDRLTPGAVNT